MRDIEDMCRKLLANTVIENFRVERLESRMNSAVVVFPGSNCDRDLAVALEQVTGRKAEMVWHKETELPEGTDFIGIPGGFSYGDYLRSGAMAARSPVMRAVKDAAARGVPVIGICNGFQVLTEAGLAARRADAQRAAQLRLPRGAAAGREQPEPVHGATTRPARTVVFPVAHHDGNYQADQATLDRLEGEGRVAFRYLDDCQRLGPRDRRHPQRYGQCARPDAAPGARRRTGARRHRWPPAV